MLGRRITAIRPSFGSAYGIVGILNTKAGILVLIVGELGLVHSAKVIEGRPLSDPLCPLPDQVVFLRLPSVVRKKRSEI